jgi:predicted Zn finger-like uncharacterized protein/prepilin-type processing-associated H-X9-DG protein
MAETTVVECPNCGKKFRISPDKLGRTFKCTGCENKFVAGGEVPVLEEELGAPPELPQTPDETFAPPPIPQTVPYGVPGMQLKTSGMAIASLVCGILGCLPFCGLLALIFGIIGITQTKPGMARGRGMAITGTVLGAFFLLLIFPAMLISILLPSLNKAREAANRAKCASNMHQIGLAILLYQNANQQVYPPDLTTLWKNSQLNGSVFVCPASNDTPASNPGQLETGGHLSYVYAPPDSTNPDSTTPILYEKTSDHANDGMNILFGDGHAEWYNAAGAAQILANVKH